MEKMDMVSTKAQELLKMTDWKDFARKIYEENTKFIDTASDEMLREWANGVHFNSGMFAGELDRIILDGIPASEDEILVSSKVNPPPKTETKNTVPKPTPAPKTEIKSAVPKTKPTEVVKNKETNKIVTKTPKETTKSKI